MFYPFIELSKVVVKDQVLDFHTTAIEDWVSSVQRVFLENPYPAPPASAADVDETVEQLRACIVTGLPECFVAGVVVIAIVVMVTVTILTVILVL